MPLNEKELGGAEWLNAVLERLGIADFAESSAYPGLDRSPKKNWVDKAGGLPKLIERVAKHLHYEQGNAIDRAIATAVNWAKKMCSTGRAFGGKVKVGERAQAAACAAVGEWEKKKASAKADNSLDIVTQILPNGGGLVIFDGAGNAVPPVLDQEFFNALGLDYPSNAEIRESLEALGDWFPEEDSNGDNDEEHADNTSEPVAQAATGNHATASSSATLSETQWQTWKTDSTGLSITVMDPGSADFAQSLKVGDYIEWGQNPDFKSYGEIMELDLGSGRATVRLMDLVDGKLYPQANKSKRNLDLTKVDLKVQKTSVPVAHDSDETKWQIAPQFSVPYRVSDEAKRGLWEGRESHPEVPGVAIKLADRAGLNTEEFVELAAYFDGTESSDDPEYLMHGGDPGREWAADLTSLNLDDLNDDTLKELLKSLMDCVRRRLIVREETERGYTKIEAPEGDSGITAALKGVLETLEAREVELTQEEQEFVADFAQGYSSKAWSEIKPSDYTDEQWKRACLIHLEGSSESPKSYCKLPVLEPDGTPNTNAMAAAAGALNGARGGVDAPDSQKAAAKRKLARLYKRVGIDVPDSLKGGSQDMSLRVQLPVTDLATPDKVSKKLWWQKILPFGSIRHPTGPGGILHFDADFADKAIEAFNSDDPPIDHVKVYEVPKDNSHTSEPSRVRGWVKALKKGKDGLYALMEMNKQGEALLTDTDPYVGASARAVWNWPRNSDGKVFPAFIEHVALTDKPWIPKLGSPQPALATDFSDADDGSEVTDLTGATFEKGGDEMATPSKDNANEEGRDMTEEKTQENGQVDLSSLDPGVQKYITDLAERAESNQKTADLAIERLEEANKRTYEERTRNEIREIVEGNGHRASAEKIAVELCMAEKAGEASFTVDFSADGDAEETVSQKDLVLKLLKETSGDVPSGKEKGRSDLTDPDLDELDDEAFVTAFKRSQGE